MEKSTKESPVKVLFCMWDDTIIAIFPEIPGNSDPNSCSSYMHIGQHGACWPNKIVNHSRPAQRAEYIKLFNELTGQVGYDLEIIQRNKSYYTLKRKELLITH